MVYQAAFDLRHRFPIFGSVKSEGEQTVRYQQIRKGLPAEYSTTNSVPLELYLLPFRTKSYLVRYKHRGRL